MFLLSYSFLRHSFSVNDPTMAPQPCWRCLTRLSIRPPISTSVTSSSAFLPHPQNFSTTPSSLAASAAQRNAPKRGRSALKLTKNKREKNYKVPSVGERRALRKRIVLSNTNALEVSDLEDFSVENAADRDCIGEILQLRGATVDGLRSCQAFRTGQSWGYFRRPATMVREETVGLAKALEGAEEGGCVRGLIVGDRGAGKSILLLQAQALALMRGWVVMTFPDGMAYVLFSSAICHGLTTLPSARLDKRNNRLRPPP